MGERAGYRVKGKDYNGKDLVSPILRKQWFIGDSEEEIEHFISEVAKVLSSGLPIDDGMCALRHDLDIGRLTLAMYNVLYSPPFDSMEFDTNCDISDHGLFEIEIVSWNHWKLNHYIVPFLNSEKEIDEKDYLDAESKKRYKKELENKDRPIMMADITFEKGKIVKDGMKINYVRHEGNLWIEK